MTTRRATVSRRKAPLSKVPKSHEEAKELLRGQIKEKDVQNPVIQHGRRLKWDVMVMYNGSQGGGQVYATPGIPDTYWCKAGVAFWIEFKRPGGELRPKQVTRIAALRAQGQVVYVIDDVAQGEAIINRYEARFKDFKEKK